VGSAIVVQVSDLTPSPANRSTIRRRNPISSRTADCENIAAGVSRDEAGYAARRVFGNVTWVKEEVRVMWGWTLWEIIFGNALRRANSAEKSGVRRDRILTLAMVSCEHGGLHRRGFGASETVSLSREWPSSRLLGKCPIF